MVMVVGFLADMDDIALAEPGIDILVIMVVMMFMFFIPVMIVVMMFMFFIFLMIVVMMVLVFFIFLMIVVMVVLMFLIFLMIVVMMVLMFLIFLMIMVMMVFLFVLFLFGKLREAIGASAHGVIDCLAAQFIPRSGDDTGAGVEFTDDRKILCQLFIRDVLRAGKNDAGCGCDLIIKEFPEVAVIDLAAVCVHHSGIARKLKTVNGLDCPQNIGKLSDTGRFYNDPFRLVGFHDLLQAFFKVTLQRAADAAAVNLTDLNAGFLQKSAVNSDFTEFIFYKYDFLSGKYLADQLGDQGSLAGAEKAGHNINFCHMTSSFLTASLLYSN
jgi:hypothetical protein